VQLSQAVASPAGSVVMLVSTNDQAAGWAASRSIAAIKPFVSSVVRSGKNLWIITELPRGPSNAFTAPQLVEHNLVRAYLQSLSHPQITLIDSYPTMAAANGIDFLAGLANDGVHPNIAGAFALADVMRPIITERFPVDPYAFSALDLYNASTNPRGNLVANGEMSGTSGSLTAGITGSLATGYNVVVANWTGLAGVLSKVSTATGDWQQLVITGNSGSNPIVLIRRSLTFANLATGDRLEGRGEFEVDANSVGLTQFSHSVARYNGGTSLGLVRCGGAGGAPWPQAATRGIWLSGAPTIMGGSENSVQNEMHVSPLSNTNGIEITVRFRNFDIRKV
jgi:hypothetical protein